MNLLINIDVDDLRKAVDFYTRAFDLRVSRRLGDGVVELEGGPVPIYLLAKSAGSRPTGESADVRHFDRHWTPVHLDVVVTDIDHAVQRAQRAGARLESPVQSQAWGRLALLADPFGNGFCLLQFEGRGYDAIASP